MVKLKVHWLSDVKHLKTACGRCSYYFIGNPYHIQLTVKRKEVTCKTCLNKSKL